MKLCLAFYGAATWTRTTDPTATAGQVQTVSGPGTKSSFLPLPMKQQRKSGCRSGVATACILLGGFTGELFLKYWSMKEHVAEIKTTRNTGLEFCSITSWVRAGLGTGGALTQGLAHWFVSTFFRKSAFHFFLCRVNTELFWGVFNRTFNPRCWNQESPQTVRTRKKGGGKLCRQKHGENHSEDVVNSSSELKFPTADHPSRLTVYIGAWFQCLHMCKHSNHSLTRTSNVVSA